MKKRLKLITISLCYIALLTLFLSACGNTKQDDATKSTLSNKQETPVKKEKTGINKNTSGKTIIKAISLNATYPNNSYMIISKSDTIIIADPTSPIEGLEPDVITSTHLHADHDDGVFYSDHKEARASRYKVENFSVKDIKVFSIASTHSGDINKDNPTNVIYVYEVDGLRIAHMGDIAQEQLTDEQIKVIGKIDIAFMQFVNSWSDYSIENGKGFKLIEQLKPQIIIPTHSDVDATKKISDIVGKYETVEKTLTISKDDLKDGIRKVIEIKNTFK